MSTADVFPPGSAQSPPSLAPPPPPPTPSSSHRPIRGQYPGLSANQRPPSSSPRPRSRSPGSILYICDQQVLLQMMIYICDQHNYCRATNSQQFEFEARSIYHEPEHFIACPKYLDISYNLKCLCLRCGAHRIMSFINSLWVHILIEI